MSDVPVDSTTGGVLETTPDPPVDEEANATPDHPFGAREEQQRLYALDMASRIPQTGITSYLDSAQQILNFVKDQNNTQ